MQISNELLEIRTVLEADIYNGKWGLAQEINYAIIDAMAKTDADVKADIGADGKGLSSDGKEPVSLMEPLLIPEGSSFRGELTDLAVELAARSAGFRRSLPEGIVTALADLVRSMNCYYSNLIEGHDTHPIDIERALKNDYVADVRQTF